MLLKRSARDILRDAAINIAQNTPFTNFSAGSIARSIVETIAPEIGPGTDAERVSLYDFAQKVLDNGFLSKSNGEFLDLIGGLFSYHRRIEQVRGEDGTLREEPISDDQYRYEISQIVPSMATANYTALRLELLTIQGVKDVIGKQYSHGTGSFSFILIPQYGFDQIDTEQQMKEAMERIKSYGVSAHVILPVSVPVDLTVKLIFHESTSDIQKENIKSETATKLMDYLGLHEMGKGIIYNDLVQEVMDANEKIVDFEVLKFHVSNEPVLLMNQDVLEDERIVPQNIQVI